MEALSEAADEQSRPAADLQVPFEGQSCDATFTGKPHLLPPPLPVIAWLMVIFSCRTFYDSHSYDCQAGPATAVEQQQQQHPG